MCTRNIFSGQIKTPASFTLLTKNLCHLVDIAHWNINKTVAGVINNIYNVRFFEFRVEMPNQWPAIIFNRHIAVLSCWRVPARQGVANIGRLIELRTARHCYPVIGFCFYRVWVARCVGSRAVLLGRMLLVQHPIHDRLLSKKAIFCQRLTVGSINSLKL